MDTATLQARFRAYVLAHALKLSRRRQLVIEALATLGEVHFTAEQLLTAVHATDPRVGLATIYRTLHALKDAGLVVERRFGEGALHFEIAGAHHDHLICTQCHTIVEFDDDAIERRQHEVATRHGFELVHHRHEIYGLCARCRRSGASAS